LVTREKDQCLFTYGKMTHSEKMLTYISRTNSRSEIFENDSFYLHVGLFRKKLKAKNDSLVENLQSKVNSSK